MTQPKNIKWYNLGINETISALNSSVHGLTSDEARRRLKEFGPNELIEKKKRSPWLLLVGQFKNFLIIMLLVAIILSAILGEVIDASVIFIVVVFATVLGFVQEYRAEKAIEALKKMAAPTASVLRDGKEIEVPARELVPGDLILLRVGDKIPVDARLSTVVNLKTDEAPLTGESTPVEKTIEILQDEIGIGDRRNMVFMGTSVVYGRGTAIVTSTGMATEFGKIAAMLQEVEQERTPLQVSLDRTGRWIAIWILILCFILAGVGILHGHKILEMFVWGVSLAVAAVPESLPAVVTICLAIGVQRMAKRHSLIRKLPAVETLGCTTFICSDKTGTLTQDQMTIRQLYVDNKQIEVSGVGYEPEGKFYLANTKEEITPRFDSILQLLLKAGSLCNDANLELIDGVWHVKGDPTEGALLVVAAKSGLWKSQLMPQSPRESEIPFSSERKRMTTIHRDNGGSVAYSKGAPEVILESCKYFIINGNEQPLTHEARQIILTTAQQMANNALRVLGISYKNIKSEHSYCDETPSLSIEQEMVFIGLVGMIDPPREEVKSAIKVCEEANIKSVMITGDHKLTAIAIARELGLLKNGVVITGDELDNLTDEEFNKLAEKIEVYARVSPAHKLRVVDVLTKKGHVVAMTGDGVNDAPALKKADIGIAMGITGTDVTKETAKMILTDDNFASIVAAVEEGRCIFSNIKKFLVYILSCNVGEVLAMAIALLFGPLLGIPRGILPLIAIQILFVNLVTDGLPAIALALEPIEKGIMKEKPRNRNQTVFTAGVIWYIVGLGIWKAFICLSIFLWAIKSGRPAIEAQCLCFVTLMLAQYFNVLNCRSLSQTTFRIGVFTNPWLWGAIVFSLIITFPILYLPPIQKIFHTYALPVTDWLITIVLASSVFIVVELFKLVILIKRRNEIRMPF